MGKVIQTEIDQFLTILQKNADKEYRKGSITSTPSALEVIGVRVPILRKISKDWVKENKGIREIEFLNLLNNLWQEPVSELRSLALELLWADKKALKNLDWATAETWLGKTDNWAHCDFLSSNIFGCLVKRDQTYLNKLKQFLRKPGKWFQRAAIVSTLQLIRARQIKAEEVLAMIDQIADNQDPMIQKAVSWILRELVRAGSADAVEKYLNQNQTKLATYVVREVTNKLKTGFKSGKSLL